jgi:peptide/nickel transport system ATP-binding protein
LNQENTHLNFKNLTVAFGKGEQKNTAVLDVSFSVNKGEILAIVGESGSGKSVTSLSAMGLIGKAGTIKSGQIIFNGKNQQGIDFLRLPDSEMRKYRGNKIAMIFQEPMTSLNPVFKCGEQVAESLKLHLGLTNALAKEKVIELFKEVLLPRPEAIYESYPHQISGGQKQRVMIAMAIACNPEILIADEPTTALDVTVQKSILELLRNLQRKHNMGIIFITHDLGVVAEIADRVLVMYKGKIVEQGPVKQVLVAPKHAYTKGLLACRPPVDKVLKALPTVSDFMFVNENGELTSKDQSISSVFEALTVTQISKNQERQVLYAQEPILSLKNIQVEFPISKTFFGKTKEVLKAVNQVSFDIFPGETLGLVGESGCGKTTLGRAILQLIKPRSGEVWYKGIDLVQCTEAKMRFYRKELQIVFQDPYSSLNPRMTIGEAIKEPMEVHGIGLSNKERKEKVQELLVKVGLTPEIYDRYPHEFSGGQRQRICIARALAVNPRFIICDESVSALDVSVQAQVLNLLNDLKRELGFTYIFISHDLSVVKYMSDRIVVMNQGKVEEIGLSDEVYNTPQHEYTKKLIAAIPKGEAFHG